jgi:hypothetical protein
MAATKSVRFFNEIQSHDPGLKPLMIWSEASEVPAENDYISIDPGPKNPEKTTWIVRYRVWRDKRLVDVYCTQWKFNV